MKPTFIRSTFCCCCCFFCIHSFGFGFVHHCCCFCCCSKSSFKLKSLILCFFHLFLFLNLDLLSLTKLFFFANKQSMDWPVVQFKTTTSKYKWKWTTSTTTKKKKIENKFVYVCVQQTLNEKGKQEKIYPLCSYSMKQSKFKKLLNKQSSSYFLFCFFSYSVSVLFQ